MKIILAPDKFKNSLTSLEFCLAVEEGLSQVNSDIEILKLPLADGGDGTIEVANYYLKGKKVKIKVNNPFFKPVIATYLFSETSKTAFIEMAEASGIKLLNKEDYNCVNATTFGTGEMISDAIKKGAKTIILGIGGSATNDCGIGMAAALGFQFLNKDKGQVKPIGLNLSEIVRVSDSTVNPKLKEIEFHIACDVSNPLYGKKGAAYTYAKQKGATDKEIELLDNGLLCFAKVLFNKYRVDVQSVEGSGAAGGMGIASKIFLNGTLRPGIELIKNLADFNSKIKNADWIITGEGNLDEQTFYGKTIKGVVTSAKKQNIKVAGFCGKSDLTEKELMSFGIDYIDSVMNYTDSINDAMSNGFNYIKTIAEKFARQL